VNDEATSSTVVADLDFRNSKKVQGFIKPMLAKQTDKAFDNKDWLFEIKWDGYRAVADKNKKDILLYSRNGLSFQQTYPIVVDQLKKIKADAILDGEIVVLNDEGKPDFQFLQHYSENQNRATHYRRPFLRWQGHPYSRQHL